MTRRKKRKVRWRRLAAGLSLWVAAVPTFLVLPWRWFNPPTTAFIRQARAGGLTIEQIWADWEDLSPNLPIAVVAAEDQRFPQHHGFDLESIQQALEEDRDRSRGASTISQQVAKNLFLWPGHSWIRKGIEAWLTAFVELLWPKRRILEIYLNIAEFGPGIFGAEAAARRSFSTSAADLTPRQAALLAAVLPNPKRLSAAEPSGYLERRVAWILRQVRQLGGSAYLDSL